MNRDPNWVEPGIAAGALPDEAVLRERLRFSRSQLPGALFAYIAATGLVALALADRVSPALLAGWWGVGSLFAAWRYHAARRYLVGPVPVKAWARFRADALFLGGVLGCGSAALSLHADPVGQSVLTVLIVATLGGAIPALANDQRSYLHFTVATVAPFSVALLATATRAEPRPAWLAGLTLLCLIFMLETVRRMRRAVGEALTLRFENVALVDELRDKNRRLEDRLAFERLILQLSSEFVHLPVEEIDAAINRALKALGTHAGVDRAYVFMLRDGGWVDNTHEWCAAGVQPEIQNLQGVRLADYPWISARLLAQQDIHVPRVADLPPEAQAERREWEREGIRSIVLVPMIMADTVHGYLGFDAVRSEKRWTQDHLALLRLAGEIFVNALERRKAEGLIHRQARYDDLTGLPNRRLFMEHLERSLALARRQNVFGAVLFVDLDRFKPINDSLGHSAGDCLLRETSRRLLSRLRQSDVAARLGGDEFAVLLPQLASEAEQAEILAGAVADKIRAAIAAPLKIGRHELRITASIGIARFPREGDRPEQALENADVAMYQAKAAGRDCVRFFAPVMKTQTVDRLRLHTQLRGAVQRGELALYLQPQVDGNRNLMGAEGLLRWQHPERGMLGADEFIPLAEDTGLIAELDAWALRAACRFLQDHAARLSGFKEFRLALNVSPATFRDPGFPTRVAEVMREYQVEPGSLEFEVTERLFLMEHGGATEKLASLQDVGIRISIDDFGVGYSSLAYLKHLPINRLKVDKSFVQGVHANRNDSAIVEAIMGVAASFGYQVVAEGVENEADFDFLRLIGVWLFQGFLFGEPLPAEEFLRHLGGAWDRPLVTGAPG